MMEEPRYSEGGNVIEYEVQMIRIIRGHERHRFQKEMAEYHNLRKKIFHDKLGWDVPIINTWEIDGYDVLDPVYLLSINEQDRVVGGVRLLPTMSFNMLNDTFSELLPEGKRIESPLIWESSRFVVDTDIDDPIGPKRISRAAAEVILGMNEIGEMYGLTHIVTVYDMFMRRLLLRVGCAGEPISEPRRIGKVMTYAVFVEVGPGVRAALSESNGLTGSVMEGASPALERVA